MNATHHPEKKRRQAGAHSKRFAPDLPNRERIRAKVWSAASLLCSLPGSSIPKGLRPPAQGCESASYPGNASKCLNNPNGVAAGSLVWSHPVWPQPLWGCFTPHVCPRVARKLANLGFEPESLWDSALLALRRLSCGFLTMILFVACLGSVPAQEAAKTNATAPNTQHAISNTFLQEAA